MAGSELYTDIIEVNPPLIFYEMVLLTGGVLTKPAYVLGVCSVAALSALWALRLKGPLAGLAAVAAFLLGGLTDFGQRDHLALIFLVPFLLGDAAARRERVLVGAWAFLGAGLKPYLLLIPIAAALTRAVLQRSLRPIFSAEMITLGVLCAGYLALVAIFHRPYLTDIVPLGQFVYGAYGAPIKPQLSALSLVIVVVAIIPVILRDKERIPTAVATLGALASYYIQGRNWSYHFVPAVGLGLFLAVWSAKQNRGMALLAASLALAQAARGPHQRKSPSPILAGATSVAFFSSHVWAAYPTALDCGVRNATRYPALWVLPGAWNVLHDPDGTEADRQRAKRILAREREIIRGDLLRDKPQLLYLDVRERKPYFTRPFDYRSFIGPLPGYRPVGRISIPEITYEVWAVERAPVSGTRCHTVTS